MVADAINLALDTNPAILQCDIKRELDNFEKSEEGRRENVYYASITKVEANKYLKKPEIFFHHPLYDIAKKIAKRRTRTERKVVLCGKMGGKVRNSKVFYRDRKAMENYVESRLLISTQTLAELR